MGVSDSTQAAALIRELRRQRRLGVTHRLRLDSTAASASDAATSATSASSLPIAEPPGVPPSAVPTSAAPPADTLVATAAPIYAAAATPSAIDGDRGAALADVKAEVARCVACTVLVSNRTQTVFADGNAAAPLMFIGEAPGADEDAQGVPFVGTAGQLLTNIIEKGMGIPRHAVYIANILKCRPPGNRDPQPDEVHNCTGFLIRQIELVRPLVIVALGKPSANYLHGEQDVAIGRLRGRLTDRQFGDHTTKVLATYHPAYLLRQYTDENRRTVHNDVKKVVAFLQTAGVWDWWK